MVSVKLLHSGKTVWYWLPHGCADQRASFVKLRLLSTQQRNWRICGWVKIPLTGHEQWGATPGCAGWSVQCVGLP